MAGTGFKAAAAAGSGCRRKKCSDYADGGPPTPKENYVRTSVEIAPVASNFGSGRGGYERYSLGTCTRGTNLISGKKIVKNEVMLKIIRIWYHIVVLTMLHSYVCIMLHYHT